MLSFDFNTYYDNKINIDERFGERKFGINSWDELPVGFGERQFNDFNYKIGNGESINDVVKREEEALINVLNNNKDKKILIDYTVFFNISTPTNDNVLINNYLTLKLLTGVKISLPLHPVISFSVINYVVIEASPRERRSLFLFYVPSEL